MSKLGGDDSRMVRRLVLILVVAGLVVGGLIVRSMTNAGEKDAELEQRLNDLYVEEIGVRTDFTGGAQPRQIEVVTIDGVDRDDCIVQGPDAEAKLSCAGADRPTPQD